MRYHGEKAHATLHTCLHQLQVAYNTLSTLDTHGQHNLFQSGLHDQLNSLKTITSHKDCNLLPSMFCYAIR